MSSQESVDGSALEREENTMNLNSSNKSTHRPSPQSGTSLTEGALVATTTNNENDRHVNPDQRNEPLEVTRILMEQMTAIQRLEVEIRQMRAEGYVQNHGSSPGYGYSIDTNSQVDGAPPSYGEIGHILRR